MGVIMLPKRIRFDLSTAKVNSQFLLLLSLLQASHGFKNVNELLSVPGVGSNILELNGNRIVCDTVRHLPSQSSHYLRNSGSSSGRSRLQQTTGDVLPRPVTRSREHSRRNSDHHDGQAQPSSSSSSSTSRLSSISELENEDSRQVKYCLTFVLLLQI